MKIEKNQLLQMSKYSSEGYISLFQCMLSDAVFTYVMTRNLKLPP